MPVQTRYLRSDSHTINGLNAYKLTTAQGSSQAWFGAEHELEDGAAFRANVYKRASGGGETLIASAVGSVYRGSEGSGIQSATWPCPETALDPTDAIKVVIEVILDGGGSNTRTFMTEQLGATQLDAATWTFYLYTVIYDSGYSYVHDFNHGASSHDSRIANFSFTSASSGQDISPTSTDSTSVILEPTVAPGTATVAPFATDSTSIAGSPSVTTGPVTVAPESVESTSGIPEPLVQREASAIEPESVESISNVPEPAVSPGPVTVSPEPLESTSDVGSPDVVGGDLFIEPASVESTSSVPEPAVALGAQYEDFTQSPWTGPNLVVLNPMLHPQWTGQAGVYDPADVYNVNTATWQASHAYTRHGTGILEFGYIEDSVHPTSPVNGTINGEQIPLYFRLETAGTSGSSEPTWNTAIYGLTNDGSCVWRTFPVYDFITLVQPHRIEWTDMRAGTSGYDWNVYPPGPDGVAGVIGWSVNKTYPYFTHKFEIGFSRFDGGNGAWGLPHKNEFAHYRGTLFWFDGDEDAEIAAGWYAVYQYTLEVRENPHTASGNVFCVKNGPTILITPAPTISTYRPMRQM